MGGFDSVILMMSLDFSRWRNVDFVSGESCVCAVSAPVGSAAFAYSAALRVTTVSYCNGTKSTGLFCENQQSGYNVPAE